MKLRTLQYLLVTALVGISACFVVPGRCAAADASAARELRSGKAAAQDGGAVPAGMARLYVFRPVRSYGAHVDDYITINGVPVHRLAAGSGFYCELYPGDYVIGVARDQAYPARVPVTPGQTRYVCVVTWAEWRPAPARSPPISPSMSGCLSRVMERNARISIA